MRRNTSVLVVRVEPELKAALQKVAIAQEMSLSDVIRAACSDYVQSPPVCAVPIVGTISAEGIVRF